MSYVKVVFGLPLEGPFDYSVPEDLVSFVKAGARVKVAFGPRKVVGFIVGIFDKTEITNVKPILELLDKTPVLSTALLALTKEVSDNYACSWGEALATALPLPIRSGKSVELMPAEKKDSSQITLKNSPEPERLLIHDLEGVKRWEIYNPAIKETLDKDESVIILCPDVPSVLKIQKIVSEHYPEKGGILYRKQLNELYAWDEVRKGNARIIIGTRSTIFAPARKLGLIIIDEEHSFAYKQDQVPHYHAREVAWMRSIIDSARLIMGSSSPSLESLYLSKTKGLKYLPLETSYPFPEIKVLDMKRVPEFSQKKKAVLSKYLEDSLNEVLLAKGKTLLFLNRTGFATLVSCISCGVVLKCPHCNINLVFHYHENKLCCHYCTYKMEALKICPNCNAGYIRYSGSGTEKIESELSRIFPSARIAVYDKNVPVPLDGVDIMIATQSILREHEYHFDLIGVLGIDNALNRIDWRSGEKAFEILLGLIGLSGKQMIIQSMIPAHHCFQALQSSNIASFYEEELKERKELEFPPFRQFALLKVRGKKEDRVMKAAQELFEKSSVESENEAVKVLSVNPSQQLKLRDNYYWQILFSAETAVILSAFLKKTLKSSRYSGIILTVDIAPI